MEILDKSGLTHFSQKLAKTNRVVYLKCTSVDKHTPAANMIDPMVTVIKKDFSQFRTANNATLILRDNDNNTRGVAQYIGDGMLFTQLCVGYIDMYIYDSANNYAQAKIMVNKGTIKKMS